jgi:phage baseplate assembly protein W
MFFDSSFGDQIAFKNSYSDFDFNFKVNPNYGDITPIRDNNAVKASIKNLIFTGIFERPFNQNVAMGINDFIFEKLDSINMATIITEIKRVVLTYEPRVSDIKVYLRALNTTVEMVVIFSIINTDEVDTLNITLSRVR